MAEGGGGDHVDHARREAVTMALYLGIVLAAEVLVIDDHVDRRRWASSGAPPWG